MGRHNKAGCLPNGPPFVDGNQNEDPSYKKYPEMQSLGVACVPVKRRPHLPVRPQFPPACQY